MIAKRRCGEWLAGALATVPAVVASVPGLAAEDFIAGVYLQSQQLCEQARKDTLQTVIEASHLVLTERGFDAIEYNCAFLQVTRNPRMPAGWLVSAMCEEPGAASPDLFALVERAPGEIEVASLAEGGQGTEGGVSGTWYRCEGVAPP